MGWLARFTDLVSEVDHSRSAYHYEQGTKKRSEADNQLYFGNVFAAEADVADDRGDKRTASEARESARISRHTASWMREMGV